jgi:hypothetical protein
MHFYISGSYYKEQMILDYAASSRSPVLASFAYPKIVEFRLSALAERLRPVNGRIKFMMDSGAFTAWSNGAVIDRSKFERAAKNAIEGYSDVFDFSIVSLDVIPGARGRDTTPEEFANACKGSAENYDYLRRSIGDAVKPVFHTGDPDWLLDEYADAEVIGLGMSQNLSEDSRIAWVRRTSERLAHKKLHGLAATGYTMMRAAPWYSVDSAAWMYAASMGALNWLRPNGKLIAIPISDKSPKLKMRNMHLTTLPAIYYEELREKMHAAGLDIEQAKISGEVRQVWNAMQYRAACDLATPATTIQQGLFDA